MATVGSMRPLGGVALKKTDTEIERLDQEKICAFSRANMKYTDLKNDIGEMEHSLQKQKEKTYSKEE